MMIASKGPIDRLFGPLELWSSSFSSKTISPKTLAMNDAIDELREVKPHTQLLSLPTLPLPPSLPPSPLCRSREVGVRGTARLLSLTLPDLLRRAVTCAPPRAARRAAAASLALVGQRCAAPPSVTTAARRCAHRSHRRQPLLPPGLAARPFRDMSWTHPSPQAMDDGKRRKIAQDAYAKGKDAINKYIELGNDGLGLNFTPIDQMD